MEEPTQQSQPEGVNTKARRVKPYSRSLSTANTKTSTPNLKPKSSSPISSENAKIAANILTAVLPTLLTAGLVTKGIHQDSGNTVLVFPSTVWTDELKLK